ncbi:hypothetical protein D3C75_1326380 [compost metagenome]
MEDLELYVFEKKGAEWKITDKTWGKTTGNGEMDLKHSGSFSTATEKPLTHSQVMAQGHIVVWFHI